MELNEYQRKALTTDITASVPGQDLTIPLLGLAGECGELLSEYKKFFRDGEAYRLFPERLREELGDVLWYLAIVSRRAGFDLEDVADANLQKCVGRWNSPQVAARAAFDQGYPEDEQFPQQMEVCFTSTDGPSGKRWSMQVSGTPIGDPLTDNAYDEDGYGAHDVFHLAYAAILGWSPVLRKLLKRKRKSTPRIDEVEDGGRATAIEEGISAFVFSYARERAFLDGVSLVDSAVLRTVKGMSSHLEVAACTDAEWERAILSGFEIWRAVRQLSTFTVKLDFLGRSIQRLD